MKLFYLACLLLCLSACSERISESEKCPEVMCTQEFRTVSVRFKDASGNPIVVNDFSAKIKRTGKVIDIAANAAGIKGTYVVISDAERRELQTQGDTIIVTATNPATKQKKAIKYVVSGGKCACHIGKLSGPEEVVF